MSHNINLAEFREHVTTELRSKKEKREELISTLRTLKAVKSIDPGTAAMLISFILDCSDFKQFDKVVTIILKQISTIH